MDYEMLGKRIRDERLLLRLTIEQLAEMVGITQQHLQRVETAHSVPSLSKLLDIADVLGVPVQKLFDAR